jgi:hypothetical protein
VVEVVEEMQMVELEDPEVELKEPATLEDVEQLVKEMTEEMSRLLFQLIQELVVVVKVL